MNTAAAVSSRSAAPNVRTAMQAKLDEMTAFVDKFGFFHTYCNKDARRAATNMRGLFVVIDAQHSTLTLFTFSDGAQSSTHPIDYPTQDFPGRLAQIERHNFE